MALDFPATPAFNATYDNYLWDGSKWIQFGSGSDALVITNWTAVSYQNSWVDYGGLEQVVQYRKVGDVVEVRGTMKSGTMSAICFTLPVGFRPPSNVSAVVRCGSGVNLGLIDILASTGACTVFGTDNTLCRMLFEFSTLASGASVVGGWGGGGIAGRGVVAYIEKITTTSTISTVVDISGLSVSFTGIAGRLYKATIHIPEATQVTTSGQQQIFLRDGADTVLNRSVGNTPASTSVISHQITWVGQLTGAQTLKVSASTSAGTMNLIGAATVRNTLIVEDIGLA